jgi:hypothetical protein
LIGAGVEGDKAMLKLAMTVLWPAFLSAILAEGLFFSLFDPTDLMLVGGRIDMPPLAAYTIGFFFFWTICALASMISMYLVRTENPQPPF